MLAGTGLTICSACNKVVPVATGHCVVCGEVFPDSTIETHVVESDMMEEEAA